MLATYQLTIETIRGFTHISQSSAYTLFNKVKDSCNKGDDYKPTVFDWAAYEKWDVDQFMFMLLATQQQAVDFFGKAIIAKNKIIILDGKYGGNTELIIETAAEEEIVIETVFNKLEVTSDGKLDAQEKEIIIKKVKKKKGM